MREKDVLNNGADAVWHLAEKGRTRKCILNGISDVIANESVIAVVEELGVTNSWQSYTRDGRNIL